MSVDLWPFWPHSCIYQDPPEAGCWARAGVEDQGMSDIPGMQAWWKGRVCPVKQGAFVSMAPRTLCVQCPECVPFQVGTVGGTEQQKAGLLPSLSTLASPSLF